MYQLVLSIHNAWRWVVVLIIVIAIVQFLMGWLQKQSWTPAARRTLLLYTTALDIQLLLGLLLFFISPLTTSAFSNFGEAMRNSGQRFFLVEHTVMMLIAVIVAHVTSVITRKQATDAGKFRVAAIGAIVATIAILVGMPWSRSLIPVF